MARTPKLVPMKLHTLMRLLAYRWAAVNSVQVGELGLQSQEALTADIDSQSQVNVKPSQLADLLYHMKHFLFEKQSLGKEVRNHNMLMRELKAQHPDLFKETKSGEVVMVELEDREDV